MLVGLGRRQPDDMGSYWTTLPLTGYRQSNLVPPGARFSSKGRVWTLEEEAMDLPPLPSLGPAWVWQVQGDGPLGKWRSQLALGHLGALEKRAWCFLV